MKKVFGLIAVAGLASVANAQPYPVEATMTFQVFDGTNWVSNINGMENQRVEYRVVIDYSGPRTDLFALGEVIYQPTISGVDNTGASQDQHAAFRNGGISGNSVAGSMLTGAEGGNGGALAGGYGRVVYGQTGMNSSTASQNTMTLFRHSAGSAGAPAGEWMRVAGQFVTSWPAATLPAAPGATGVNNIQRGVASGQTSFALAPTTHVAGVDNLVIFRGAITLSDALDTRTLVLNSSDAFLKRTGGTTSTDDRRYMTWQTSNVDAGSYRTGVTFVPATITLIPTPATAALLGLGGLVAARRRRA